jgi:hypothetical protein
MTTATKQKVSDIVQAARKIAAESNRPMSPDEIKGKFQLEFPFTVKRVIQGDPNFCPCGPDHLPGGLYTFTHTDKEGTYIFGKCHCGKFTELGVFPDSKRFVLV